MTTTTETAPDEADTATTASCTCDSPGGPVSHHDYCELNHPHHPCHEECCKFASAEADTAATGPLTLTEFIAARLCSKHILDGRFVQMSATADGTRINIDIEHPFPPEQRIQVVAHLEVLVPELCSDCELPLDGGSHCEQCGTCEGAEHSRLCDLIDGVEIGASA